MRVLAHVHLYPPTHNAGAELMLHTFLRQLTPHHEVKVLIARGTPNIYTYQSVECTVRPNTAQILDLYRWADIAITHLDLTRGAMKHATRSKIPLVHLVHNDRQLAYHRVTPDTAQLVIYNSDWIAAKSKWSGPSITIPPPVIPSDYATQPGQSLTLVNISPSKGAETFYELARLLPKQRFLGVKGAYDTQILPTNLPSNVTIIDNTPEMKTKVYSRTKILLMPSDYESWGRVGIEAAASGIPTIAHPTPGLLESLSYAGTFVDRSKPELWVEAINEIQSNYAHYSALALKRSQELDPTRDLQRFELALLQLVIG